MANRKEQPAAKAAPVTKADTAAAEKALGQAGEAKGAVPFELKERDDAPILGGMPEARERLRAGSEAGFTVLASAVWQNQGASFQSVAKLADGSKIEVRGATEGETNEKLKEALAEKGYSGESLGGYDGGKYNEWLRASAAG